MRESHFLYNEACTCRANSNIGGFFVVKYREILRLHAQGLSQRSIAASCSNSRNTVKDVLE